MSIMAVVISLLNMKGGVGKTTLAAAVAVEADMTARRRNDRQQPRIVRPVEGAIVLDRNPRIVARRQNVLVTPSAHLDLQHPAIVGHRGGG